MQMLSNILSYASHRTLHGNAINVVILVQRELYIFLMLILEYNFVIYRIPMRLSTAINSLLSNSHYYY